MSGTPAVNVEGLASGYYGRRVIEGVSFSAVEPGVYVVLGPNGAGKTTLLRTIAGILKPLEGRVEVCGHPADSRAARRCVGYLTHLDGIPESMRVAEAMAFYAKIEGATEEEVEEAMKRFSLEELSLKRFSELSRGQKKRVAVARVFLRQKEVYLLDEPTANLDPKVAGEIRSMVLAQASTKVVLYSSHNLYEAREIGRYVIALKQGRLALYKRMDELRVEHYVVGVRTLDDSKPPNTTRREGEYYLYELAGPDEVPKLVQELLGQGVKIREIREMGNPLEELFK